MREHAKTADSRRVDASVRTVTGMLGFHASFKSGLKIIYILQESLLQTVRRFTYLVYLFCVFLDYFLFKTNTDPYSSLEHLLLGFKINISVYGFSAGEGSNIDFKKKGWFVVGLLLL